jgi:hypothetical protein
VATKTCTKCGLDKTTKCFSKGEGYKDGIRSQCKKCVSKANLARQRLRRQKTCKKCGNTKNASEFSNSKNIFVWCKKCCAESAAKWRAGNPEKAKQNDSSPKKKKRQKEYGRVYRLFRKYGVTMEDYSALFEKQGGACAICRNPPTALNSVSGVLNVDHDHRTGQVRGLLCRNCNTALEGFKDEVKLIDAARDYLTASMSDQT